MRNVTAYIDGFNLYHAIDDLHRPHLKWVDLFRLVQSLLRADERIAAVKYFSAFATWMPDRFARHRDYVAALQACGVTTHMAQFKEKHRHCHKCQTRWTAHEEKETDVQIAVHMVADALSGTVDRLIVVSADTDLAPAIRMIAARAPECEIFVATPPGRFRNCRALGPKLEIRPRRIADCLLPEQVGTASGRIVIRPANYAPPTPSVRLT